MTSPSNYWPWADTRASPVADAGGVGAMTLTSSQWRDHELVNRHQSEKLTTVWRYHQHSILTETYHFLKNKSSNWKSCLKVWFSAYSSSSLLLEHHWLLVLLVSVEWRATQRASLATMWLAYGFEFNLPSSSSSSYRDLSTYVMVHVISPPF